MATSNGPAPIQPVRSGINLLDNWYFVGGGSQQGGGQFPINQRGSTTWNGSEIYMFDRWLCDRYRTGKKTISLVSGGVSISNSDSTSNSYIDLTQKLETDIIGSNKVTFSVLETSGLRTCTFTGNHDESFSNFEMHSAVISGVRRIIIRCKYGQSTTIKAVKLELGDTQTLAHQENGEWVLNDPPPNYNIELLKCQLSTADSSDTYANKKIQFVTT